MPESGVLQSCIISIRVSSFMRKFGLVSTNYRKPIYSLTFVNILIFMS